MKAITKALDRWSIMHFAVGVGAQQIGMSAPWYIAAAVAYEIYEQKYETNEDGTRNIFKNSGPESALNAVSDIGVGVAGYYLSQKFWSRK